MSDTLSEAHYFSCPVYMVKKAEFVEKVRAVSDRYLSDASVGNGVVTMTGNFSHEEDIAEFSQYVSQTAWNILASQGYAMDNLLTYFTEMWTQEHNLMSSMETHLHGMGAQISAFFFLDVPEGGCKLVIHDPRPAKVIINLPQKDEGNITAGSNQIVFTPEVGTLILTNSWLPHAFTRNTSDKPTRFVHMNLSVTVAPEQPQPQVEIV